MKQIESFEEERTLNYRAKKPQKKQNPLELHQPLGVPSSCCTWFQKPCFCVSTSTFLVCRQVNFRHLLLQDKKSHQCRHYDYFFLSCHRKNWQKASETNKTRFFFWGGGGGGCKSHTWGLEFEWSFDTGLRVEARQTFVRFEGEGGSIAELFVSRGFCELFAMAPQFEEFGKDRFQEVTCRKLGWVVQRHVFCDRSNATLSCWTWWCPWHSRAISVDTHKGIFCFLLAEICVEGEKVSVWTKLSSMQKPVIMKNSLRNS